MHPRLLSPSFYVARKWDCEVQRVSTEVGQVARRGGLADPSWVVDPARPSARSDGQRKADPPVPTPDLAVVDLANTTTDRPAGWACSDVWTARGAISLVINFTQNVLEPRTPLKSPQNSAHILVFLPLNHQITCAGSTVMFSLMILTSTLLFISIFGYHRVYTSMYRVPSSHMWSICGCLDLNTVHRLRKCPC